MTLGKRISEELQKNLDAGCDATRLSNLAFILSQDNAREISDEVYDALFELILMQEGPEFFMADNEIRSLIQRISNM